jgi:hypothetical protein
MIFSIRSFQNLDISKFNFILRLRVKCTRYKIAINYVYYFTVINFLYREFKIATNNKN